jgi:FkbM family methyltransferase
MAPRARGPGEMTIQARRRTALDHGRARWLLAPLATADVCRERREPCLVLPSAGWLHRYRSGWIEWDTIGAPSPAMLERDTVDVFLHDYTPRPGDAVVDVGAGVGEEVRTFSRLVGPNGTVLAVEAHPRAAELLRRNVRRWGVTNVTVVEAAVTARPGTLRLSDDGASVGNRLVREGGVEVPATTLDGLLEEAGLARVDFLKMNIEGAEAAALRSSTRLGDVTDAAISCHDFLVEHGADPTAVATSEAVEAVLRGAGFAIATRPADPRPWVRYHLYARRTPPQPPAP